MANLNKVMLIGNVTRDPELRTTTNGTSVTQIGLAINRSYLRNDERIEETTFIDIESFGKQAETICQYVEKGRSLYVEGRLKLDQWESDGQKRSKLKVIMEGFQFLGGRGDGGKQSKGGDNRSGQDRSQPSKSKPQYEDPHKDNNQGFDFDDDDIPF